MRTTLALVLLAIAPALVSADDWKGLSGTWAVEKAVLGGADTTGVLSTARLTLGDGKYVLTLGKEEDKGTIAIDAAKKPKEMDIVGTEGPNKGKTYKAIYEVSGDTLKICYALEGEVRPTEFESKAGSKTFLVTYVRKK
jgi:uncharacterized protein (TIGR03067 family)